LSPVLPPHSACPRIQQAFDLLGLSDPRAAKRFPCAFKVGYRLLGKGDGVDHALVLDISAGGLRITTAAPLRRGAVLLIIGLVPAKPLLARVIHTSPGAYRGWISGVAFALELPDERIETLLSQESVTLRTITATRHADK
jgi:hypothetical protein